jgi:hypothetical protein
MGDRTSVTFTIRKADQEQFEKLSDGANEVFEGESLPNEVVTIDNTFHGVYPELGFESKLKKQKIPYDKAWDSGGEHSAGTEYHRITQDGESVIKTFIGETEGLVPFDDVVKAFESGEIENYIAKMKAELIMMSWSEQNDILSGLSNTKVAVIDPSTSGQPTVLEAQYVTEWEEGSIYVACKIDTSTIQVLDIETSESNYQHLESEYVELKFGEKNIQLDADNGQLTEAGINALKNAFNH